MKPFSVNRSAVRRFLLEKQGLVSHHESTPASDPETVLQMICQLECVQLDPVSVVERNQHLVLGNRLSGYKPEHLNILLTQGKVLEYIANAACVMPIEDYSILGPVRERLQRQVEQPLKQLDHVATAVLNRLETEGPLPSRAFKSNNRVHGYWDNQTPNTKETSQALNLLLDGGFIRVVYREGNERFFAITKRTIPENIRQHAETLSMSEAQALLTKKYMRAYRLFDPQDARFGWQKMTAAERRAEIDEQVSAGTVIPLDINNVKRPYFILADDLDKLREMDREVSKDPVSIDGPIRFLSPLDNLLWRRERLVDLFDFRYRWEIYTPQSKRRYGPYAMPILYGDRLIGRIDPRLDRKDQRLLIRLLQLEPDIELTPEMRRSIQDELNRFAAFHQARDIVIEQTEPNTLNI
ncbi:winged helix-turn-helix domain-containing protein [Tuberibacillus sp. Marseille-P3662]|uniref:winged helix-turn-helix domain-containing protein n=1 Tax=Tuberibacillus sp. Marseille-P3662 TaxID=1965358 RepID=UPI000A1CDB12|nr:crosslink repair DNA glycosylase YcaQ family protein [Tuberibacillus sp. Marseille-P3662]